MSLDTTLLLATNRKANWNNASIRYQTLCLSLDYLDQWFLKLADIDRQVGEKNKVGDKGRK